MPEAQALPHVSSFVVHCLPQHLDNAKSAIAALEGTEIHGDSEKGKLIVLLESPSEKEILSTISDMEAIDGVITATMVYHQIDQ